MRDVLIVRGFPRLTKPIGFNSVRKLGTLCLFIQRM